jgi:hypothetical protein
MGVVWQVADKKGVGGGNKFSGVVNGFWMDLKGGLKGFSE